MSEPSYVATAGGEARIWVAGSGGPVLVLGGLVAAASSRADALARIGGATFVVVELPGFGQSVDGTPRPTVESSAHFVTAVREALGLETAPILAFDGASAISAVLIGRNAIAADRVGVVDAALVEQWRAGTAGDTAGNVDSSLARHGTPRSDGLHLSELWSFLRDRALLSGARVSPSGGELPPVAELEAGFLSAIEDPEGYWALWSECIGSGREPLGQRLADSAGIESWIRSAVEPRAWTKPEGGATSRMYVQTPRGRVHCRVRRGGERTVFALASAPGSTEPLTPLLDRLGERFTVIAPDYLGNGLSDKPESGIDIHWIASSILELADALGVDAFDLWGTHTGALVALEISLMAPDRVGRAVLEAPILLGAAETEQILAHYFHDITETDWGDHVLRAWNLRRDMFLFWPWFTRSRATGRTIGVPDVRTLHRWTVGLLQSGRTYPLTYRAAFEYPTAARLPGMTVPSLICAGPADMLAAGLEGAGRLTPGSTVQATAATIWYPGQSADAIDATLALYERFLEGEQ